MRLTGVNLEGLQQPVNPVHSASAPGDLPAQAPQLGHPREDVQFYLSLLLDIAEAMAATKVTPFQLNHLSNPPVDIRALMVADLRRILSSY